jgi:hypothetical protein
MKQTAVEWLMEIQNSQKGMLFECDINQAKEMEKEQIIEAFDDGWLRANDTKDITYSTAEDFGSNYYEETFNK